MRDRLQRNVACEHAHPCSIGIFDETPHVKKGDRTPGVQRQWCAVRGTTDNCTITVHLGYAAGDFHCLLDGELYLPKSWHDDRKRCRAAGIPDDVVYRSKVQIALDMHATAMANGVRLEWVTFDEGYGKDPTFLHTLDDRGQRYVGEVFPPFTGWLRPPPVMLKEHPSHSHKTVHGEPIGRPRDFPRVKVLPGDMHKAKSAKNLAAHSVTFLRQQWKPYYIKDTTKGPVVWMVKSAPFYLKRDGVPTWEHWLIVCKNPLTDEMKYFVSNAPPGTPLEAILHVAFQRWHVERCFQDEKSELGLSHFEVRTYRSLIRHLRITAVSHLFLAKAHQQLRGEPGEPGPGGNT
jgi:SRSO17 transposase